MQGTVHAYRDPAAFLVPYRTTLAQAMTAYVFGVTLEDMRIATRGQPRAALARQVAMYLSHIVFKLSPTEVSDAFARDRSTVVHAFRHVEELREDSEFDRTLGTVETMLRAATGLAP